MGAAAVAPLIATTSAGAATAPGWRVNANVRNTGFSDQFSAVTADAPNDAWAVGGSQVDNEDSYQPLVSHWNGRASVWAVGSRRVGSTQESEGMILLNGRVPR